MLTETILTSRQVALFPKLVNTNHQELVSKLLTLEGYDGAPTIIPTDDDGSEGVAVALKSADGKLQLQYTKNKINIFWTDEGREIHISNTQIIEKISDLINKTGINTFARIGYISQVLKKFEDWEELIQDINTKLIASERCIDLTNYNITLTYKTRLQAHSGECNKVVGLVTGKSKDGDKPVIIINCDLNTSQNEDANINHEKMIEFINEAYALSSSDLIVKSIWQN
jgi:hypothetical protein